MRPKKPSDVVVYRADFPRPPDSVVEVTSPRSLLYVKDAIVYRVIAEHRGDRCLVAVVPAGGSKIWIDSVELEQWAAAV